MPMKSEHAAIFQQSQQLENDRIRFLETTRGSGEALAFARQTCTGYRRAVVSRSPPAGDALFRLRLLASYCYLKRYLNSSTNV